MTAEINVWWRLTPPAKEEPDSPAEPDPSVETTRRGFWHRIHLLDLVAAPSWFYGVTKALVDWDSALLRAINPDLVWLTNFRFLVIALLLLGLILIGRKLAPLWLAYIALWPLLIIAWRVPRILYKRDQWNYIVGLVHIVWSGFASIKNFLAGVVLVGSTLFFLVLPGTWTAVVSFVLATVFQAWLIVSAVKAGLRPSRFLSKQRDLISRAKIDRISTQEKELEALQPAIESSQNLTAHQSAKFLELASSALLVNRLALFWAYRVHAYRKSPAIIAYGAMSVLWLFVGSLVAAVLANRSMYQVDPGSLNVEGGEPTIVKFTYYALTSMTGGETEVMEPANDFALAVKTAMMFIGILVILTLSVALIMSIRYSRDEKDAEQTLDALRDATGRLSTGFTDAFYLRPDEAVDRLIELQPGFAKWLIYLRQSIPDDFLRGGRSSRSP